MKKIANKRLTRWVYTDQTSDVLRKSEEVTPEIDVIIWSELGQMERCGLSFAGDYTLLFILENLILKAVISK